MDIEAILLKFSAWLDQRGSTRMITRTLFTGNDHFPTESPYMKRHYLLNTPWFSVFLHCFFASDRDDPHDHPWSSVSIPLFPGFTEVVYLDPRKVKHTSDRRLIAVTKERKPFRFYYRTADSVHRIQLREGFKGRTWSLFIHLKRVREWGFWRYVKAAPEFVLKPGQSLEVRNDDQLNTSHAVGLRVTLDYAARKPTTITNNGPVSVMVGGVPPKWEWLDFKRYGREVIGNHNIESGSVPNGDPDYKIVGWLLPRVVYAK